MSYLKKCFELFSGILANKRFIVAWSVFYCVYLCLMFLRGGAC